MSHSINCVSGSNWLFLVQQKNWMKCVLLLLNWPVNWKPTASIEFVRAFLLLLRIKITSILHLFTVQQMAAWHQLRFSLSILPITNYSLYFSFNSQFKSAASFVHSTNKSMFNRVFLFSSILFPLIFTKLVALFNQIVPINC